MDDIKRFLIEIHGIIEEFSKIEDQIAEPTIVWEEFNLTQNEQEALNSLIISPEALSALKKIIRDNMMGAFHDAFCLIDGVADPYSTEEERFWLGLKISERKEDDEEHYEFLHDELYGTYWDWKEIKEKEE